MENLYVRIQSLCDESGIRPGRLCDALGLSRSLMTDLKMGRRKSVKAETAGKLADYFGVAVQTLLDRESADSLSEQALKFALFGGDATDAQLEEVRQFARFVRARDKAEGRGE